MVIVLSCVCYFTHIYNSPMCRFFSMDNKPEKIIK